MVSMDVIEYLNKKNIPFTPKGRDLYITCPECGKEKLSIDRDSGVGSCLYCRARNKDSWTVNFHISKLQEESGDVLSIKKVASKISGSLNREDKDFTSIVNRYDNALLAYKPGLKYLALRGITLDAIKVFKLGYVNLKGESWISIPAFEENTPQFIKYRRFTENYVGQYEKLKTEVKNTEDKEEILRLKETIGELPLAKYTREFDSKSILFNQDCLQYYEEINIVEGEFDTIMMTINGYPNTVGITGGAGTLLPEWYELLLPKKKITLVFDNDEAGQKAAEEVWALRLGLNRCKNVILPAGEDVSSVITKEGAEEFSKYYNKATKFTISGIASLSDAFDSMYKQHSKIEGEEVYELPWLSVNQLFGGGIKKKRLIVVGAPPATGKTSLAMQIVWHFAKMYNLPSLVFCMEMPKEDLASKIVQLENDLTLNEIEFKDALLYKLQLNNLPIYFGYSSKITPDVFYNTMVEVRNRYGVGIGVFDNLQRMIRSGEEADMGKASGMFKDITMDLNMPFLLISQPKKLGAERDMVMDDMKGTSAIPADADHVLIMNRKKNKSYEGFTSLDPVTSIFLEKSRYSGGGRCKLLFQGERSKFIEYEEKK